MPREKYIWHGQGVTWREYVDLRFDENRRAIDKAESAMTERLQGMNEFRDTLKDQASRFVTRDEVDASLRVIRESLKALELGRAKAEGAASQTSVMVAYAISAVGVILAVAGLLR